MNIIMITRNLNANKDEEVTSPEIKSDWEQVNGKDTKTLAQIIGKAFFVRQYYEDISEWGSWQVMVWREALKAFEYNDGNLSFHIPELKDKIEFSSLQLNLEKWKEALPGWLPRQNSLRP